MVIVGALLILAVLLDAWRRVYQDRRQAVRMKLADTGKGEEARQDREVDITWLRELPNGGARVVDRDDSEYDDSEQRTGDFDGSDSDTDADTAGTRDAATTARKASTPAAWEVSRQPRQPAAPKEPPPRPAPEPAARKPEPESKPEPPAPVEDEVELVTGMRGTDEPENLDWLDALEAEQKRAKTAPAAKVQLPRDVEPEVFMLNVVARSGAGFRGEDILHILLACDLRFGDMDFFHRHEQEAGRGPIQFSVANMMQPGVFDIDNMSEFTTPGLVFFLTLPGPEDMMKAFEYMLETAQVVARNLEGDVLDETRSVLTRQTLEHSRQQIRDLERRLLAKTR